MCIGCTLITLALSAKGAFTSNEVKINLKVLAMEDQQYEYTETDGG